MDNSNFEGDQENFFKMIEGGTKKVGQIREMEKFVRICGDIWDKDDITCEVPWIERVSEQLRDKITSV